MDRDLRRDFRNRITSFLGSDTKIYLKGDTVLIDTPRVYPNKISVQSRIREMLEDTSVFLRKYKLIFLDPEHTVTNDLKRFRILAEEII